MPVAGSLAALLIIDEFVRPTGRLLPEPIWLLPLPMPWQSAQVAGAGTTAWYESPGSHAATPGAASARWQMAQSFPITVGAAWFIHCRWFDGVAPSASV